MRERFFGRRTLFTAAAMGAAASVFVPLELIEGATVSAMTEKANLKFLRDFIATWSEAGFDPDKTLNEYLAEDARVRFSETAPVLIGPAAVAAPWKVFISEKKRGRIRVADTYAKGPIVLVRRIETVVAPGKPDETQDLVGVFLVKGRKIKEWSDYTVG